MTRTKASLSQRGTRLAAGPDMREMFRRMLSDLYDPDTNPTGFCNIGVSENYAMLPEVLKHANEKLSLQQIDLTYGEGPWGTKKVREYMARFMTKHFNAIKPIDPDKLIFGSGVTSICNMLAFAIADSGDGIILPRPIYQAFKHDFGAMAEMKIIYTDFDGVDQFQPEAVAKFEATIKQAESSGTKVRALMLCNPNNPLGQCYPKETIIGLMKLCDKYKIHLIADEVYATSVYKVPDEHALPFTSVLSFDTSEYIDKDYLHVLYSMSKDFGAGGLRMGCIYSQNDAMMMAIAFIAPFHWSGGLNMTVAEQLLADEAWLDNYVETAQHKLSHMNKLTRKILDDADIKYHLGANAGFFLWIDLRPYLPKIDPSQDKWDAERMLMSQFTDNGVFMTNGEELSAEEPGWFRIIFSQEERTLREALKRVFQVIGKN